MTDLLQSVRLALPTMEWSVATVGADGPMQLYTGKSADWAVQLVCRFDGQKMGTARTGALVLKLPDDLATEAKTAAEHAFKKARTP